jgi:hypothetical protein
MAGTLLPIIVILGPKKTLQKFYELFRISVPNAEQMPALEAADLDNAVEFARTRKPRSSAQT